MTNFVKRKSKISKQFKVLSKHVIMIAINLHKIKQKNYFFKELFEFISYRIKIQHQQFGDININFIHQYKSWISML